MDRQVIVRLCSGLGNQLFQITCGLAVAHKLGAHLACDTSWYALIARMHRPVRRLRLDRLLLPTHEAFCGVRRWSVGLAAAVFDRWGQGRNLLERIGQMSVWQEQHPLRRQPPRPGADAPRLYLNGYWQTADHFLSVREALQPMLGLRHGLSPAAQSWMTNIRQRSTCFVHVRRGDYATLVGETGLLPVDYYRRGAEYISNQLGHDVNWLVFTEDEAWARQHLGFLPAWQLVDYPSEDRDLEDLQLMAACQAGIIANSSYSWWGAALGDRADRPIIAPDRYWNRPEATLEDWALPTWQRLTAWK